MAKKSAKRPALEALSPKIDRKKMSLTQQTLRAERLMKSQGISRASAMAKVARRQVASQGIGSARESSTQSRFTKLPLRPRRPKDPFAAATRLVKTTKRKKKK